MSSTLTSLPIDRQISLLCEHFPQIGFADTRLVSSKFTQVPLKKGAEGWFAIPRWQSLAKSYGEAVEMVLRALEKVYECRFADWYTYLTPNNLRQSVYATDVWKWIGDNQKGSDILLVQAQLGVRYRNCSTRLAMLTMEKESEFGLGLFAVGIMLLTHADQPRPPKNTSIICPGDQCNGPNPVARLFPFSQVPEFFFKHGGELNMDMDSPNIEGDLCGAASGWLISEE